MTTVMPTVLVAREAIAAIKRSVSNTIAGGAVAWVFFVVDGNPNSE